MMRYIYGALAGLPLLLLALPAHADECTPVRDAMVTALQAPHTAIVTRDVKGQPKTQRVVQTSDNTYVEMDGKWIAIGNHDAEKLESLKTAKMTCTSAGKGDVDGKTATIYAVHVVNDGDASDHKMWIGAGGKVLKTESSLDGKTVDTVLDWDHAETPPGAVSLQEMMQQKMKK